jgi:hydrogenase-4 membrane subunit HyfE
MPAWFLQLQSVIIVILMLVGISLHRNRKLHIKLMSVAMIWDVLLILQIELARGAVAKASRALSNPLVLNIHVSLAVTTVVFYVVMVTLGRKIMNGKAHLLDYHKFFGRLTMALRILTLITSYWATP